MSEFTFNYNLSLIVDVFQKPSEHNTNGPW